jgi:hypothetical protein
VPPVSRTARPARWLEADASATWSPQPGLELRSEVFAIERDGQPVPSCAIDCTTPGTRIDGTLSLVVRRCR